MDFLSPASTIQAAPAGGLSGFDRLQSIAGKSANGKTLSDDEIREVGKQFESLLMHQLLSAMRKTVEKSDLFGESSAQRIYDDMFDEKIASAVAESGQSGVADVIIEEIKRQQESVTIPEDAGFLPLQKQSESFRELSKRGDFKPIQRDLPASGDPPFDRTRFLPLSGGASYSNELDRMI